MSEFGIAIWALDSLPDHHKDPFDRLSIAQAQAEGMTLVSADGIFGMYAVALLVV
jgi:PIN domain nuclease of toxin-antitoxin system